MNRRIIKRTSAILAVSLLTTGCAQRYFSDSQRMEVAAEVKVDGFDSGSYLQILTEGWGGWDSPDKSRAAGRLVLGGCEFYVTNSDITYGEMDHINDISRYTIVREEVGHPVTVPVTFNNATELLELFPGMTC